MQQFAQVDDQFVEFHRRSGEAERCAQRQRRLDDHFHAADLVEQFADACRALLRRFFLQQLQLHLDRRQRVADFVGDTGCEVAAPRLAALPGKARKMMPRPGEDGCQHEHGQAEQLRRVTRGLPAVVERRDRGYVGKTHIALGGQRPQRNAPGTAAGTGCLNFAATRPGRNGAQGLDARAVARG